MTSTTPRVRGNVLGSIPPQTLSRRLSEVLRDENYNRINIRPSYQRQIKWKVDAMCDFIYTVMNNGLVPVIYMYRFHPDENEATLYDEEVMDGQHRLWTLKAFMSSKIETLPHIKKPFIVHWCYETIDESGNKHIQRVFYKETPEVVDWFRETYEGAPCFLTPEEKKHFNDFALNIATIHQKLSINERREIFLSLQKGVPVRNSDLLKNMTSCKLIAQFEINEYEPLMEVFLGYCSKKAKQYWTQWAVRCYLLYEHSINPKNASDPPEDTFLKSDSWIGKAIKNGSPYLDPSDAEFEEFDNVFRSFIEFLQKNQEGTLFNPTNMFALFYHLCSSGCNTEVLITHMSSFSKEGQNKYYKSLWESKDKIEERKIYFSDCLSDLKAMTTPYVAISIDTKPISKALRKQVFEKAINSACYCCKKIITFDSFEAGHIKARALGGLTEIDNLFPSCVGCNRSMGTLHPDVYKKTILPDC
jgi:hypothetical protein